MKEELLQLCKMHDAIKDNEIRLAGIDGNILLPKSKERYYNLMSQFVYMTHDYFDKYQNFKEIKEIFDWMKQKNYDLNEIIKDLEKCYAEYDDIDFIAAVDFLVFSKLHYIIEYAHFKIFNKYWDSNFSERLS